LGTNIQRTGYRTFVDPRFAPLASAHSAVDPSPVSISSVSSAMSGVIAAQSMFGLAAQAASGLTSADGGSGGSAAEAVQVALLQKTLDAERSQVNILA
jgi:hypothetical protein